MRMHQPGLPNFDYPGRNFENGCSLGQNRVKLRYPGKVFYIIGVSEQLICGSNIVHTIFYPERL